MKQKEGTMHKNRKLGILFIILAALFFSLMNMFVKMSGELPSIQKSFFRNFVAFFFAMIVLIKNHTWFSGKRENLKALLFRSTFGTVGILCNFYAVDHLVLSDASMLNKMSPFFAIVFSIFILKEKVKPTQALIVLGAFVGSLLIIKPTFANMNLVPSVLGFLGGMGAGIAYTYVRKLGMNGEKGPFIVFFFSGFSCLVTLPYLIFHFTPMTMEQLLCLMGAGLSAAFAQFSITAAYFHAPAKEISVYDYSQIAFSAVLGFIMFGQVPDFLSWVGYIIIFAMAVWMFLYNQRQDKIELKMAELEIKKGRKN